ncbi:MAG: transglutaminase-like cysteine peptidase [Candidatus Marinarcus sp.]|uniref:transglutaminase-like cysteine peptidase n=1 Tax=Candidatus Marinarcus sp. TaxID=3100987 RepID=UPI003B005527
MKQIIILILLLSYSLYSKKLLLNNNDLDKINSSLDRSAIIKRLQAFQQMRTQVHTLPTKNKLAHVNAFFNRILPVNDATKYNSDDYWATRKEFLINGKGDCEDYAIAKYFTLVEVGIPKEKLYFAVVKVKGKTTNHMVLLYFETPKSVPWVLDNLSFKILPLTQRTKLIPKFVFNEIGSYRLTPTGLGKKVKINWGKTNKWENLLTRIYSKNE